MHCSRVSGGIYCRISGPSYNPWLLTPALSFFQCYLYVVFCPARALKAWGLFLVIGLCNLYLYGLRSPWQISFHVCVALLSAGQIVTRRPLDRRSDLGV